MRTREPGEDLNCSSLRACPQLGCVAVPDPAGWFPASLPVAEAPGFTMRWLTDLRTGLCTGGPWSGFVFCFLSMFPPVPYCPFPAGEQQTRGMAGSTLPKLPQAPWVA